MADWLPDYRDFDDPHDDIEKIERDGKTVPCRICWIVFGRYRLTSRYCAGCKRAFCEGEHGSFRPDRGRRAVGICVRCFSDASGNLA